MKNRLYLQIINKKQQNYGNKTSKTTKTTDKKMKRLFISFYLVFQAYFMLFAPISCECKQSIFDLLWFIMVMGGIGIFSVLERDISKFWTKIFKVTGYISFFFCAMFIVTFNSDLITNYLFNLSIYLVYLISILYVIINKVIQKQ